MKKIFSLLLFSILTTSTFAQDFDKSLTTARTSYASGDLENARFAMESMLRDLDVAIGKEIIKLLPAQLGSLKADVQSDNVNGSTGLTGLFVQRVYGASPKQADLEIINNSPLMNSIGAIINTPLGGLMQDENQKIIKVQGYKSLLNKTVNSETGKTHYELQIPMNNTLLTLKVADSNETEIIGFANTIPLPKIVQIAQ